MEMRTPILASFCALLAVSCGPAEEGLLAGDRPAEPYVYTDQHEPLVEMPAESEWDEMMPPELEQVGEDNGDTSLSYSAILGGYYILRVQLEDGSFNYKYDVKKDEWIDENMIHRQCGTTYTQAWMYRVTKRDEFKYSTQKGLEYLHAKVTDHGDGRLELRDIGATALLTLGTSYYARFSGDESYDERLIGLGEFILSQVDETGKFTSGYTLQHGQSMQALWHLYEYTGDEKYLDNLEKIGKYLYDHPEEHNYSKFLALWANEPLAGLYGERPADWIPDFSFKLADPIVDTQLTAEKTNRKDWLGGYPHDVADSDRPSWNTSLQLEAVIDAYLTAEMVGDEERMERYEDSALRASGFLMSFQYRKGETEHHAEPDLIVGALPFRKDREILRVDVTHHLANSLIKVVEALDLDEDYPGRLHKDEEEADD